MAVVAGQWLLPFMDELEAFPNGALFDISDKKKMHLEGRMRRFAQ